MHLHSSIITIFDLFHAERIARVDMVKRDLLGSRIRSHKFNVNLEGESNRRPNNRGATDGYAATWDQWGVFLSALFDVDPDMVCGSGLKYATYRDRDDFHHQTGDRFQRHAVQGTKHGEPSIVDAYWPRDAHGDHRFVFSGTVGVSNCTKCSAQMIWRNGVGSVHN